MAATIIGDCHFVIVSCRVNYVGYIKATRSWEIMKQIRNV